MPSQCRLWQPFIRSELSYDKIGLITRGEFVVSYHNGQVVHHLLDLVSRYGHSFQNSHYVRTPISRIKIIQNNHSVLRLTSWVDSDLQIGLMFISSSGSEGIPSPWPFLVLNIPLFSLTRYRISAYRSLSQYCNCAA